MCVEEKLRTQASRTPAEAIRNPIRAWSGFLLCGHEFVKLVSVEFPADVIRSFPEVSQDSLIVMVRFAFISCLENRTPIFAWPPARFVFVFQRVTVFIGNSVKAEHWFLGAPGAKSKSALCQGVVFFPSVSKEGHQFPPLSLSSRREVDEGPIDPGQCAKNTVCRGVSPCEVRLGENTNEKKNGRGQRVKRRSLSRRRLKVSSGSKWTLTTTRFRHPDRMLTMWSRPWQVTTCVTTASSGKRSI